MPPSRRHFIRTVIAASGAVLVSWPDVRALAASEAATVAEPRNCSTAHRLVRDGLMKEGARDSTRRVETVIIGGGPAGLAAAWRLRKARREFVILENESSLGGTLHTPVPYYNDTPYPLGATYFYAYDELFRQFYSDIGAHHIETSEDALVIDKDHIVVDWWNKEGIDHLPFPAADIEGMKAFGDRLRTMIIPPFPLARATRDDLRYDTMSAGAFVAEFRSPALRSLIDLYCRSVLGGHIDHVSAYALLNAYAPEFGESFDLPCHTFAGGLSEIALKAAEYLGADNAITNAAVFRVSHTRGGGTSEVMAEYVDTKTGKTHGVIAKRAIVAIPKRIARRIIPELSEERAQIMGLVHHAPYVTVGLCCKKPLFPRRAFDFWFNEPNGLFTDVIDATSAVDRANGQADRMEGDFVYMLSAQVSEQDRANLQRADWLVQFAHRAAAALNAIIPGSLEAIEEMRVLGFGHNLPVPHVGVYTTVAPYLSAPIGNIFFAGADTEIFPSMESALGSGFAAAERVVH
jgi:protoporphyrinogen oxidase